nr:hypothetical protein SHINE37_42942 [Rhizobiaceae bacterium]
MIWPFSGADGRNLKAPENTAIFQGSPIYFNDLASFAAQGSASGGTSNWIFPHFRGAAAFARRARPATATLDFSMV